MIGNNYLKQLTFGARANPPVPICRATRDHEPRRGEGSALPIRLGLAATRLETSAFAAHEKTRNHSDGKAAILVTTGRDGSTSRQPTRLIRSDTLDVQHDPLFS